MFNLTGSEIMFLLIIGLVVLGPEKLPDAIRRVGRLYAELKKMSSGVQSDFRKVMDEPIKEMMNATNSMKSLFTDTANQVESAAKDLVEPMFVPYGSDGEDKIVKSVELPIVLYDATSEEGADSTPEATSQNSLDDVS